MGLSFQDYDIAIMSAPPKRPRKQHSITVWILIAGMVFAFATGMALLTTVGIVAADALTQPTATPTETPSPTPTETPIPTATPTPQPTEIAYTPFDPYNRVPMTTVGKSILVVLSQQMIYAFDNGVMVYAALASTGLPQTPTVLGDYAVYIKYEYADMYGADYYLHDVPYVMYFYQGYGIHGTYWHSNFGTPMSHGCVNLPPSEAAWFFQFAEIGTPVRVVA
jgi:lipoprotein-anchoring transpeptidase ErfK/SrfK